MIKIYNSKAININTKVNDTQFIMIFLSLCLFFLYMNDCCCVVSIDGLQSRIISTKPYITTVMTF